MSYEQEFSSRVDNRDVTIGIVGLGYVGLPLAAAFSELGFKVVGIDVDAVKVGRIMSGISGIHHISDEKIGKYVASGLFKASTDFVDLRSADAILICVPTPLGPHREPDLSFVERTCESISDVLQKNQLIVLESTTFPGTSADVMVPILESGSGLKVDADFFIAYSPEREDPGNLNFETATIPKVVGADNPVSLAVATALYGAIIEEVVEVSSLRVAEAVKLTENIFRSVNIALVNELKVVFEKMNIDIWEVIDAASTKPFGFMPFYPGPGLGGHCIPIDPFYLTWKAHEYDQPTRFIELAGEINKNMPFIVVEHVRDALSDRLQKALNGARILIIGIAYKKNVDDMRESPSLTLLEQLENCGAIVEFYDPFIPVILPTREHAELNDRKSIEWTKAGLSDFDLALISTDHDMIDWAELVDAVPLVVDTRNATRNLDAARRAKVVKA